MSCSNDILAKWTRVLQHFFTLNFGAWLISHFKCEQFQFHQMTWHPFVINTSRIHYQGKHFFFPQLDVMCFQSVPPIFFEAVYTFCHIFYYCINIPKHIKHLHKSIYIFCHKEQKKFVMVQWSCTITNFFVLIGLGSPAGFSSSWLLRSLIITTQGRRGHCGNILHVLLKCSIVWNNRGIELEKESGRSSECTKKAPPSTERKMSTGVPGLQQLRDRRDHQHSYLPYLPHHMAVAVQTVLPPCASSRQWQCWHYLP